MVNKGPRTMTRTARTSNPARAPNSAGRHPLTLAAARMSVKASTTSTSEPRNDADSAGIACAQLIMLISRSLLLQVFSFWPRGLACGPIQTRARAGRYLSEALADFSLDRNAFAHPGFAI